MTRFVVTRNQNAMVAHDHHLNNSTEPIYENIPLPWQNEGEMRGRTQSIHSAPEISQVVNHSVVNAVQSQLQKLTINNQQGNIYVSLLELQPGINPYTLIYVKNAFTDSSLLETLTEAASRQHSALHNLPQGTAEEYYICACQRLDGYGQEVYVVKDHEGVDTLIGICLTGVYVGYPGGKEGRHFSWSDISNVINHKRDFTIESVGGIDKAEFQFNDVESAKNAWRFCVLQHIFYRQYEMNNIENEKASPKPPVFQQNEDKLKQRDSYEDVTNSSIQWDRPVSSTQSLTHRAQSTSCLDLNKQTDLEALRSLLPSYRPAPDYETAMQLKYRNSSGAIPSREPLRDAHPILYSSQPEIHQTDAYPTHLHYPDVTHNNIEQKNLLYSTAFPRSPVVDNMGMLHVYKSPPPYPTNKISSNSTPDLAGISQQVKPHTGFVSNIVSGSSPDLVSGGNFYLRQLYAGHPAHPVH
uniref:protein-tyrosine-phosphatase n=1 Tax=Diabrotica virgifera virgifera TaxID=50390 RepID=A0A6P7H4K0_DIAVI